MKSIQSCLERIRRPAPATFAFLLLLGAAAADAAVPFTGRFARSNGAFIDIPLIGNNPGGVPNCGQTTTSTSMTGASLSQTVVNTNRIPGNYPIHQGYRFAPGSPYGINMTGKATPPLSSKVTANGAGTGGMLRQNFTMYGNMFGCLSGTGSLITPSGKGAPVGPGDPFTIGTMAFSRGFPMTLTDGMGGYQLIAVSVPLLDNIIQLATYFQVTAPPASIYSTGPDVPNGTLNTGANTAKFRYFHQSAWKTQTGRAGPNFTWCFGNPGCLQGTKWKTKNGATTTSASSSTMGPTVSAYRSPATFMGIPKGFGVRTTHVSTPTGPGHKDPVLCTIGEGCPNHEVFVKYTAGPNQFGGTMSHIINASGSKPSSLAVGISGPGILQMLNLAGMGSQPTGRGYADFLTDPLMGGDNWPMYQKTSVYIPQVMESQVLVTNVTGVAFTHTVFSMTGGISQTVAQNNNFGFAFTTGTVLARNTGLDIAGMPVVVTLTGMGGDRLSQTVMKNTGSGGQSTISFGRREISLVAGAAAAVDSLSSETPALAQMFLRLPEPKAPVQLFAGVAALIGVAVWRSRKVRR